MPNRNAEKGRRWEASVRDYLREWLPVEWPRQEGFEDKGDLIVSPFSLQCKDEQKHNFSGYLDDAGTQAKNAGEKFGAAVVKRRGKGASVAYTVLTLATFRELVWRVRTAEMIIRSVDLDAWSGYVQALEVRRGE